MKVSIFTPVVTIFDNDGKIDYDGNRKVINYLIENGIDGIVPLGSTGEFTALNLQEKKDFIKFYVEEVAGRVELIPGTGSLDFNETVELTKFAHELGVKGTLVLPPYYFGISQEEAFHYYDRLAQSVPGNIYIYNFKDRTGFDMSAETCLKLAKKHKNIAGMKDSTDNVAHTKSVIYTVTKEVPSFEVFSGFDDHFIANVIAGGSGCIAALSNIRPRLWADWVKAYNDKNFGELMKIARTIDALMPFYSVQKNFSLLFKKIMKKEGLDICEKSIFPFEEIEDEKFESALKSLQNI